MSLEIEIAGEEVVLLPERGLFWPRESLLLIADWHVGKAATFRAAGIAVPDGDLEEEFVRLDAMIETTGAGELLILGDFVHARAGMTQAIAERLGKWIATAGVGVALISGNHDRSAGMRRGQVDGLRLLGDAIVRAPFVLQQEPGANDSGYVLAGHLHPAARLGEGKGGGLRAPCFWFGKKCGVMPAFGGFTGGHRVEARAGDRVFVVGGGEVIGLTP